MNDEALSSEKNLNTAGSEVSPNDEIIEESNLPKMSKNQQKRLLREARRKETKSEWRKLQKTKRKLKEQLKKEECSAKGKLKYYIFF